MKKSYVVSINISDKKGISKTPLTEGRLEVGVGLLKDAHSGNWHRQLSLLSLESIKRMRFRGANIKPGDFAENITVQGIELYTIPVGSRLMLGPVEIEITQIGKKCNSICAISRLVGDCVMPREGVFARVIKSGVVRLGDPVYLFSIDKLAIC